MNDLSRKMLDPFPVAGSSSRHRPDPIDFRRIVMLVRKHKWFIIVLTSIVVAITAAVVSLLSPVYRSTVTVLFANNMSETGFERSADLSVGTVGKVIDTQQQILRSRSLAERVVRELNLTDHWEYNNTLRIPDEFRFNGPIGRYLSGTPLQTQLFQRPLEAGIANAESAALVSRATSKLLQSTSAFSVRNTDLLKISVDSRDRALAPKIANGYVEVLREFYLDQSSNRDSEAEEFLENKVVELKAELEDVEQRLLRERRNVGLSGDGGDTSGETIAMLNSLLVEAKTQLELATIQRDQIRSVIGSERSQAGSAVTFQEQIKGDTTSRSSIGVGEEYRYVGTPYEYLPIIDANDRVQDQRLMVQEAVQTLEELDNRYGPRHPRVVDARSNLKNITGNLDRQISNVIVSVENQYRVAQRKVASIQADIRREESKQFDRNTGRISIKEIELVRDSSLRFYEEAVEELRSYQERDLQTVPMSVSDYAIPGGSVKPKKELILLLSIMSSLGGLTLLVFLYEGMKDTVQGVNDIEKKLQLPVFGILPVVKTSSFGRKSVPLVPEKFKDKRGAFTEAVWTIGTNFTLSEYGENKQVVIVTSSVPGEGKSSLALNLAHSLSELENVVLLEADMRRPGIGTALGLRKGGLHEVLAGEIYLEDSIRKNAIGALDVIPAGRPSQAPGKLLALQEFGELIELLKERYDRVIVDLAPVQAVSDALVVGKYADSAIYVVKSDSTPMAMISRGVKRLSDRNINVSGVVISQVDLSKVSSYGGDYYYEGYYDYYGYGDAELNGAHNKLKTRAVERPVKTSISRPNSRMQDSDTDITYPDDVTDGRNGNV